MNGYVFVMGRDRMTSTMSQAIGCPTGEIGERRWVPISRSVAEVSRIIAFRDELKKGELPWPWWGN